jgi:hypothetical protein
MKYCFVFLIIICNTLVFSQNQIITPSGQPLKVGLLDVTGNLNINTGVLMFNNNRFISATGTQNAFVGQESGTAITTGSSNTFLGFQSGLNSSTGSNNTFLGSKTGVSNTTGNGSLFVGYQAGRDNTTGNYNTFIGYSAGLLNTSGGQNVFIGYGTGTRNSTGTNNLFLGNSAGNENTIGSNSTYIGYGSFNANTANGQNTSLGAQTGFNNITGTGNVFIGHMAGYNETGSNKLYISNTSTSTPLIYGDFSTANLTLNGKVGAATSNFPASVSISSGVQNTSSFRLFVKGGILTEQIIVASGWADYVFEKGYKLKPLEEVENYIKNNGHLPNIPSAKTIEMQGINVGDITRIQQEKIEELTLYIIQLKKQVDRLTNLVECPIQSKN